MTTFIIALLMALGFLNSPSDVEHLNASEQQELIQQIVIEDVIQM